jgi:signal transduction histidine kinase
MKLAASQLVPRLVFMQLATAVLTDLVAVIFAPRLLLLSDEAAKETLKGAWWVFLLAALLGGAATALGTHRFRSTLRALTFSDVDEAEDAGNSDGISRPDLLGIYALPARITAVHLFGSIALAMTTLLPGLRPPTNDLYRQVSLIVLYGTIVAAGALPFYVRLRGTVSRVLETAPHRAAREAIQLLEVNPRGALRLQTRFLVAVAGPVAFVALGAALLVYAHARAVEGSERARTAADVAQGTFDLVHGDGRGREAAVKAAEAMGYRAALAAEAAHGTESAVTAQLEDGPMVVRYDAHRLDSFPVVFALLATIGILVAAMSGRYIGSHFSADVSLVTQSVRSTGVADVIRGTRMIRLARFISVGKLMNSIEELGDIFREFAGAQAKAIQAREATERMRGLFLASMSHDLKAPLNAILGFANLASRANLSDGQRESLTIIEQRGRELLHLIQTILDAARVEAAALVLTPELTNVEDVVMSAILDARDLGAGGTRVSVVGEVQPAIPRHRMDALRIVQALGSVISSAVRFTEEDGTVVVRATFRADLLRIDVETAGRGLLEGEREKLFEAFKDADKARRHGALGLGLSLARSLIELHEGTIDVTSEEERMVFQIALRLPHDGTTDPRRVSNRPPALR